MNIFQKISTVISTVIASAAITISSIFPNLPFIKNNPDVIFSQAISNFNNLTSVHYDFEVDADYSYSQKSIEEQQKAELNTKIQNLKQQGIYEYLRSSLGEAELNARLGYSESGINYSYIYLKKVTGITDENISAQSRKVKYDYTYNKKQNSKVSIDAVKLEPNYIFLRKSPEFKEWYKQHTGTEYSPVREVASRDYSIITRFLLDSSISKNKIAEEKLNNRIIFKYKIDLNSNKIGTNVENYDSSVNKILYFTFYYKDKFDPEYYVWVDLAGQQIIKTQLIWNNQDYQKITVNFSNFNKPVNITEPKDDEQLVFNEPDLTLNEKKSATLNDINCPTPHDESKKYSTPEAATYLGSLLKIGLKNSYNKFKCDNPQNTAIPQKARDVYTWADPDPKTYAEPKTGINDIKKCPSCNWNPERWPDDYIECIAFVFMSYNMSGNPINKKSGSAITLAGKKYDDKGNLVNDDTYKDQFEIFTDGETKEIPKVGDLMVWEEKAPYGHVGIITKVDSILKKITIYNSNSTQILYNFSYTLNEDAVVNLSSSTGWRPDYWSRKK